MEHEHLRGADNEWYLEHLEQEHYVAADPTFSRATVMGIHRQAHEMDAQREQAHKIAPFHDRRPRQTAVIERKRPLREELPVVQQDSADQDHGR